MLFRVVSHLVAHSRLEYVHAAIFELGGELDFEAEQDVPFLTPMIGDVTLCVSTMRTRIAPKCCVRHVAWPASPWCVLRSIVAQSVVPKAMLVICMGDPYCIAFRMRVESVAKPRSVSAAWAWLKLRRMVAFVGFSLA